MKPEKGTPFGRRLPVYAITGSTPRIGYQCVIMKITDKYMSNIFFYCTILYVVWVAVQWEGDPYWW